ncbi:Uncharacterised protein [Legionella pneumophila]|nr:Uncharacterised protein [Legionella pneumophila]
MGVSLAIKMSKVAKRSPTLPIIIMLSRQPKLSIRRAKGVSPPIAPIMPMVTIKPVNNANFCAGNQLAANFMVPTAANAETNPIISLATQAMKKLSVMPKAIVLTAQTTVARVNKRCGPK